MQTARAVENFPISGLRAPADLVDRDHPRQEGGGRSERRARTARRATSPTRSSRAADEILAGELRDQFVVDVYQAGAGTSHNMNANEVLANRAGEMLGEPRGSYTRVHPNDHVNMGQSTNDVFPTATRLALLLGAAPLVAAARDARRQPRAQGGEFADVLKTGRTHLQDAVPITLGQEFSGYAECVRRGADDVDAASEQLRELNIGATAVGTGLNAGDDYRRLVVAQSRAIHQPAAASRRRICSASRRAWATCSRTRARCAGWRSKSARWRAISGCSAWDRAPGSRKSRCPPCSPARRSCPGKVNPSVPEMVNQVCFQVMGCDATVAIACEAGQLELNVMMPVIAWNALHASTILREAMKVLRTAMRRRHRRRTKRGRANCSTAARRRRRR